MSTGAAICAFLRLTLGSPVVPFAACLLGVSLLRACNSIDANLPVSMFAAYHPIRRIRIRESEIVGYLDRKVLYVGKW